MSKVWYCVNCGYEVGSRGRCHRCRVKLDLSPLPELEVGDEDDEVGYRLDDWADATRGKLIVALIRANVRHRFEDDELVVGADDEEKVDDLVAAVAEIPDDAEEDDEVVFAVTPAAPSEGVSRNYLGDTYVPGFGELDPKGRPVDSFVTTPLTGAEFQVIAEQVRLLHAAAHRLEADPTDMEADGQVAEASAAVFITDRFRGVDTDTWAAVGRTTRRLLAALGAEEAQEDEITRQAAILSALLDVVANDDAKVVAALEAKEDEDRLAGAAEGQDLDDDPVEPATDAADEAETGEDEVEDEETTAAVADDDRSGTAAEADADADVSGRGAGGGYNPDEETVYELPVEWLPEQRAELTILLHTAGIEPKWDRGDLVVPADREADVEGLFDRIHGTQNTDEQDEAQYQEISELFAATSRLAGDPDDLARATEVLRALGAVDGSTPFGFDGLKWTAIRKRARLLADSIEGKAQPDVIGTEAGSLRDLLPRTGVSRPLGLLLAPGAGAGRDQPSLVAIDEAATAAGTVVTRMDFPYRLAGRRAPDRAPVLVASVITEAQALADVAGPVVVGGRSMGGRICSMAAAPDPGAPGFAAAGVVLISYPLHPPGRPEKFRVDHFPNLVVPCLFVSGTRDAFATPDELEAATAGIPGLVSHKWIDGGDHGLRGKDARVADIVGEWIGRIFPNYWHPPVAGADASAS